jgi:tryptophan synthase alpha chain
MNLKKNPRFRVNLMGHVIAREPDAATTEKMVEIMVEAGASVIEVQIPFSEPTADGPVFLRANHRALENGATYDNSMELVGKLIRRFGDRCDFLVMTYLNIPYQRGYLSWAKDLRRLGVKGTIIPDLPIEHGAAYEEALREEGLFNVRLVAPHGD